MPRTPAQFEAMRHASQDKIVESACKLFSQYGFQATTISMIARESGLSGGLVYAYFEDKEKLLDCVLSNTLNKLNTLFASETSTEIASRPVKERIFQAFEIIMKRVDCFRLLLQLMMQEGTPPLAVEKIRQLSLHFKDKLSVLFPEDELKHLPGMIHATITSYLVYHNEDLFQRQKEAICQMADMKLNK